MTLAERFAQDRRLVVLRSLCEAPAYRLNEAVLKTAMVHIGHDVGRDVIRGDVSWLEAQMLVRVDKIQVQSGELWIVCLTQDGEEVALGRAHPGVRRRSPD